MPFYQRIGMSMPENLKNIKADQLCEILGIANLHIIDSADGKTSPSYSNEGIDLNLVFKAVLVVVIMMFLVIVIMFLPYFCN